MINFLDLPTYHHYWRDWSSTIIFSWVSSNRLLDWSFNSLMPLVPSPKFHRIHFTSHPFHSFHPLWFSVTKASNAIQFIFAHCYLPVILRVNGNGQSIWDSSCQFFERPMAWFLEVFFGMDLFPHLRIQWFWHKIQWKMISMMIGGKISCNKNYFSCNVCDWKDLFFCVCCYWHVNIALASVLSVLFRWAKVRWGYTRNL